MYDCAPHDALRIEYTSIQDKFGHYDLLGVACRDWADEDCQVWVYVEAGQFARADEAACAAESAAVRAEGYYAAACAAYQAAYAVAGADADGAGAAAVARASKAAQAAASARAEAADAAVDAHQAARQIHRYTRNDDGAAATRDDDRAADLADTACAAAARAAKAEQAARDASEAAKDAALDAGVDPAVLAHQCGNAEDDARYRACRDWPYCRSDRMPSWRPTEYCAGRFGRDWYRALKELAAEYLGAST